MEDPNGIGGYDLEFIESVPEDLECGICLLPVRDPEQTRCTCAKLYCHSCIERQRVVTGRCPTCREALDSFPDGASLRRVRRLQVKCSNKKCSWKGELGSLRHHLEGCAYVVVPCSAGCGDLLLRGELSSHLEITCALRPYTCPHCGAKGTYRQVAGPTHLDEECPRLKVACRAVPSCGMMVERREMEAHVYECGKPKIHCRYATIGCDYVGIIERLEEHHRQAVHDHLALAMEALAPRHVCPVVLRVQPFDVQQVSNEKFWRGPPFYSHALGYKLCLSVNSGGYGEGKGTHVSVYVGLMRGENDDRLTWPLRAKFNVALLNQLEDSGHFEKQFLMDSDQTRDYNSRVKGTKKNLILFGEPLFISHMEILKHEEKGKAKYVTENGAFFRVNMEVLPICKPWLTAMN